MGRISGTAIMWSSKGEEPDWNLVEAAIMRGHIKITSVDNTGSDMCAVVMSTSKMTQEQAKRFFDNWK